MYKELIVKENPKSPISEIFRTLRTNIQFMNTKNKLQSLLITSTIAGEGKSWISANLAVTFAQAGKRVIILDADMRKGRQYRIFDISPRPGLSNYLSGVTENDKEVDLADYLQETEIENLFVIPAGNVPPNPSELLVSESMISLLENLKEICDIVIIDGPPTQLVTDSLILARIADSTVIVAEGNKTKKESLRRIVSNIQKVGGKIAGVILNKMKLSAKKYEQSYYYGFTGMVISKKNKKGKRETKNDENISYVETKNRNTERARQLVNQNRKKEKEETEKKLEKTMEIKQHQQGKKKDNIRKYIKKEHVKIDSNDEEEMEIDVPPISGILKNNIELENEKQKDFKNNHKNNTNIGIESEDINNLDEKTRSIIKQVNEYLENEKKNLNNLQ